MITTITDERYIDYSNINIVLSKEDLAELIRFGSVSSIHDRRIVITLSTLEKAMEKKNEI